MKISIALCTYNGQDYLHEQLQSYLRQARLPDELIICDDASADCSPDILHDFAQQAPFSVQVVHNDTTLGSTKNFERAISLCSGDIILLSDQDDVWLPSKVGRFEQAFADHPQAGIAISDAALVDAALTPMNKTNWDVIFRAKRFIRHQHEPGKIFTLLLKNNFFTGSSMGIRSTLRPQLMPLSARWVHDGWIAIIGAAITHFAFINEPLTLYRQHKGNQIGVMNESICAICWQGLQLRRQAYIEFAATFKDVADHLDHHSLGTATQREMVRALCRHIERRATLPRGRMGRLRPVMREVAAGNYTMYSNLGLLSALRDLLAVCR